MEEGAEPTWTLCHSQCIPLRLRAVFLRNLLSQVGEISSRGVRREFLRTTPGSAGGLPQFDSSGSQSDKLPPVNRSKFYREGACHARQRDSKPYQVGLQVSCGVYPEVSSESALPRVATASWRSLSYVSRAKGMSRRRGTLDGRSRAHAPVDSSEVLCRPGRWLHQGENGHPHCTHIYGTT